MELIIGGAYQGKLEYAKKSYSLEEKDIYQCRESSIEFGAKCIYGLENYTLWCVKNNRDAAQYFKSSKGLWENSILICSDISCGVVPMDPVMRAWREANGRLVNFLSGEADRVVRLFCGLPEVIK
jgi:adenosyl cobinamide kinase/adenosyl cobinamide phosphate guanylyltransferase